MVKKVLDGASNLLGLIAGVAVILMMLHINLDVLLRYVFSAPFNNTVEIVSPYYIVAIVFLPFALVERLNANIVVELLSQHLPKRMAELLIALVCILTALYFSAFTWAAWGNAVKQYEFGEVIMGNSDVTVWPTRFYLPIGGALVVLMLLYKSWRLLIGDESVLAHSIENEMMD
jgi:TRAP-type C4-dicarboxylate transport system permease small subunit